MIPKKKQFNRTSKVNMTLRNVSDSPVNLKVP